MGLSTRTSDYSGLPLGEGYIRLCTSAGNAFLVTDPAEANAAITANPGQFQQPGTGAMGDGGTYNTETALTES